MCWQQAVKLERGEPSELSHSHSHSHSQIPPPQVVTDSEVEVSMMVSALTQPAGLPPLPNFSSSRSSSSLLSYHPMVSYDSSSYSHTRSSQPFLYSDYGLSHMSSLSIPTTSMVGQKRPRDEVKDEPAVEEQQHQFQHQQFTYGGGSGAGLGSTWPSSSSQENLFEDVARGTSADCSWAPVMESAKREQSSSGYYSSSSPSYTTQECSPDSGHLSDITRAPHFSPPQDIFQGVQIFCSTFVTDVTVLK